MLPPETENILLIFGLYHHPGLYNVFGLVRKKKWRRGCNLLRSLEFITEFIVLANYLAHNLKKSSF